MPSYEGGRRIYDYPTATEAEAERAKALAAGHGPLCIAPFTRPSLIAIHLASALRPRRD
jgi:hypothetical protein